MYRSHSRVECGLKYSEEYAKWKQVVKSLPHGVCPNIENQANIFQI